MESRSSLKVEAKDSTLKVKAEAKDSTVKSKTKDFKIDLEDEELSSRTPTLVNIELNVLVKHRILYTFSQYSVTDRILSCCP